MPLVQPTCFFHRMYPRLCFPNHLGARKDACGICIVCSALYGLSWGKGLAWRRPMRNINFEKRIIVRQKGEDIRVFALGITEIETVGIYRVSGIIKCPGWTQTSFESAAGHSASTAEAVSKRVLPTAFIVGTLSSQINYRSLEIDGLRGITRSKRTGSSSPRLA